GLALGYAELGVMLEELGRAVHPGPFFSSAIAAVCALRATSGEEGGLLQGIASGRIIATLALSDADGRGRLADPTTRAGGGGNSWRVTGAKLAPDAAVADLVLLTARLSGGEVGLFALTATDADVTPLPTVDGTRKLGRVALRQTPARRIGGDDVGAALSDIAD